MYVAERYEVIRSICPAVSVMLDMMELQISSGIVRLRFSLAPAAALELAAKIVPLQYRNANVILYLSVVRFRLFISFKDIDPHRKIRSTCLAGCGRANLLRFLAHEPAWPTRSRLWRGIEAPRL